jgi:tetratricopeptide (TPR) repeat protein
LGKRAEKIVPGDQPASLPRKPGRPDLLISLGLLAGTFLLYIPSYSHPFLDFDDPKYIHENPIVQRGLTLEGVRWAFTTNQFANWLPITWLSHMLDCQLYGMNAHGHHVTNGILHAVNAALLFVLLQLMTRARTLAAVVAILFAVHPLRVESVSWIAERKDVLCATFFLLTLIAYVLNCRRPSLLRYATMLLLYALGLMSKTMIVTLPCVLLLLDYWPLERFARRDPRRMGRLVLEKVPLLLLAMASSIWTVALQRSGGALNLSEHLTVFQRFGNAAVSVPRYLAKMIRPVELSPFHPHPGSWPTSYVAASVALVMLITAAVLLLVKRKPYLAIGWFWFLGMLVPVSGLAVQAGEQSMADRYTYLPGIGLLIAIVWGVSELAKSRPQVRSALKPVVVGIVVLFAFATVLQQRYWSGTRDLFEQAVAVDPDNWYAHGMLGFYHSNAGDEVTALSHYEKALAVKPSARLWLNSGMSLYLLGRFDEAIRQYQYALSTADGAQSPLVHYHLGNALARVGRKAEAARAFTDSLRLDPSNQLAREALTTLGMP